MTILYPGLLQLGVLATVVVIIGHLRHARRRRRLGDFLGGPRGAGRLSPSRLYRAGNGRILLLVVVALALGLGASEPRQILTPEADLPARSPNAVVLAIDVSASMQAADIEPTRLARAAVIAREFLERAEGTRVGLILFAGKGYTIAPPTEDLAVLEFLLQGVAPTTASAQDPGSLLSAGIRHAATLLSAQLGSEERAIVLLTDGEAGEADSEAMAAVHEATDQGITLHAIGIGTPRGGEMSLRRGTADTGGPVLDRTGNPGVSRLQEPLLRELAQEGGGAYAAGEDAAGLRGIYRTVRPTLGGTSGGAVVVGVDLTLLLIGGSLLLLLLEGLIDAWTRPGRPAWLQRTA